MKRVTVTAYPERAPADYLAAARANFPSINFDNPAEVAKWENRTMWQHNPGPSWDSHARAFSANYKRISCGRFPKVDMDARYALILGALPGTAQEVADRAGVSIHIAGDTLRLLRADGLAVTYRAAQSAIWQRAERLEAAE